MASYKNTMLRKIVKPSMSEKPSDDYFLPTLRFDYMSLPAAKDWKIGETYKLMLEVEQTSANKDGASFKVSKVGPCE